MKALIVTALITLLAGCAGTGAYSSGDMGTSAASGANNADDTAYQRDDVFHSWVN